MTTETKAPSEQAAAAAEVQELAAKLQALNVRAQDLVHCCPEHWPLVADCVDCAPWYAVNREIQRTALQFIYAQNRLNLADYVAGLAAKHATPSKPVAKRPAWQEYVERQPLWVLLFAGGLLAVVVGVAAEAVIEVLS